MKSLFHTSLVFVVILMVCFGFFGYQSGSKTAHAMESHQHMDVSQGCVSMSSSFLEKEIPSEKESCLLHCFKAAIRNHFVEYSFFPSFSPEITPCIDNTFSLSPIIILGINRITPLVPQKDPPLQLK